MTEPIEPTDLNATLREEVQQQLRLLCMGRIAAAHRLAELLVPPNLKPVAAPEMVPLPVIEVDIPDEPAKATKRSKKAT